MQGELNEFRTTLIRAKSHVDKLLSEDSLYKKSLSKLSQHVNSTGPVLSLRNYVQKESEMDEKLGSFNELHSYLSRLRTLHQVRREKFEASLKVLCLSVNYPDGPDSSRALQELLPDYCDNINKERLFSADGKRITPMDVRQLIEGRTASELGLKYSDCLLDMT